MTEPSDREEAKRIAEAWASHAEDGTLPWPMVFFSLALGVFLGWALT